MSDSISIYFKVPELLNSIKYRANFPFFVKNIEDQKGNIKGNRSEPLTAKSPIIKNAKFKVTAAFENDDVCVKNLIGYFVSINIPACTIGNNILIENDVYSASLIALFMLQHYLISNGATPNVVKLIKLEDAELLCVSLTYIFNCTSNKHAIEFKSDMKKRGQALKNQNLKPGRKKHVFGVGASDDETVYFNHRDYKIKAYVKDAPTTKGFTSFPSVEVSSALYAIGKSSLRVEIDLKQSYLSKNKLTKPIRWQVEPNSRNLHDVGLLLIQKYLRFDADFRSRAPAADIKKKLCTQDRVVLDAHLRGDDVRNHPEVKSKATLLARQKYYSSIMKRIMEKVKVDISIRWSDQRVIFRPELPNLLAPEKQCAIPAELKPYCFCSATIPSIVDQLKLKNRQLVGSVTKPVPKRY